MISGPKAKPRPSMAKLKVEVTCYECGELGHYKRDCSIVKLQTVWTSIGREKLVETLSPRRLTSTSKGRPITGKNSSSSPHSRDTSMLGILKGTTISKCLLILKECSFSKTADFQGTADPHDAASIPKSPNDYTPTDVFQTSGGDEGLLDIYALNREVRRLKKPYSFSSYHKYSSSKAKTQEIFVMLSNLERKSDETEEVNIEEKEASNVKSGETEELDLETTQSTARQGTITPRILNFEEEAGPSSPLRQSQVMEPEEQLKAAEVLVSIS
ncbi:reverse transcriptase domain-containing protein [Tanacetum coccineum]